MKHLKIVYALVLALAPQFSLAQQIVFDVEPDATVPAASAPIVTASTPAAVTTPTWKTRLDRWLDLNSFDYGNRYRSAFSSTGAHGYSQGQQKLVVDGKFKFDAEGKYGIGFHLSSGRYFNWSYADYMGGGQLQFVEKLAARTQPISLDILSQEGSFQSGFFSSGGTQMYLRQLYLTAKPIRGVEAQYGGLGIEHGVNTEATSYDDNGYMAGERLMIKRPKQIFLSEVAFTYGYLGDIYVPNFFARGERLATSNYWQVLGRKDFGKRLAVSADYTVTTPEGFTEKIDTTREGIYADTHESKVFTSVRFEAYQRLNAIGAIVINPDAQGSINPDAQSPARPLGPGGPVLPTTHPGANGYAVTVSRSIGKHFSVDGGMADIDTDYSVYLGQNTAATIFGLSPNGDQFGEGKRYFVRPTVPLNSYLSLTGDYNNIFDYSRAPVTQIWNGRSLTAGVVVDVKRLLSLSSPK